MAEGSYRKGIAFDQIVALMRQRRSQDSILFSQGIEVRDRYNGDVVIPLTDVKGSPVLDIPAPRLIAQAIDGSAMQASSSRPSIVTASTSLTEANAELKRAIRRNAMYAHWHHSAVDIKLYRSYRHLAAYGTNAWTVMPDENEKCARIELRDPLTAYPELRSPDDVREPKNVGFIYGRSIDWIFAHYPQAREFITNAGQRNWDTLWDMVEWIDQDEIVMGILGPRMPAYSPQDSRPYGYNGYELKRWRNKAGMVPVAVPRRATLDRIMGQVSTLINTVDLHSRMMALAAIAAEKHTFPDIQLVSSPGGLARLADDQWHDGRTGKVNIVQEGQAQFLVSETPPFVMEMMKELESGIRESGGASGFFAGENPGGLRTGNAVSAMGSYSIDPRVEEMQKIQARALTQINRAVFAVEKGYWPSKTFSMFTGLMGDDESVEYVPERDLTTDQNMVIYPVPGADVNQMTVAAAQLAGSGLASKHEARLIHPLIADAEASERQILIEQLDASVLAAVAQGSSQGSIPPADVARIKTLVKEGKSIEEAVTTAHQEAQKRQATEAPPAEPGQAAAPETQPGLAPPGAGAEQPPPQAPGGPTQALTQYQQLSRALSAAPKPMMSGSAPNGG
jgi:hypothetical protein